MCSAGFVYVGMEPRMRVACVGRMRSLRCSVAMSYVRTTMSVSAVHKPAMCIARMGMPTVATETANRH
jgi:hypothetical protein